MTMGTSLMESMAREGLKLFAKEEAVELDREAAESFKAQVDERLAGMEAEAAKLTGKDNKNARAAKGKEIAEIKADPQYIDACKVVKGLDPKHGFFVKRPIVEKIVPDAKAEPKPSLKESVEEPAKKEPKEAKEAKEAKKSKKEESAGLSPAETRELEKLKEDIVKRKEQLKAEGLSGGQQNKDPQVVEWVNRMNELKEKQEPGSTKKDAKKPEGKKSKAPLSLDEQKEMDKLKGEIEAYKHKLKVEFGYSNKDIKADPELAEMENRLAVFEKREG